MTKFLLPCLLFSSTLGLVAFQEVGIPPATGSVALIVDGKKLTVDDLERKKPTRLFQARNAYFEAERTAMDEFINDYLLEQQAQKENVTVAELLEKHVNSTIAKDPTEDAMRLYYEGIDTKESFEALRDRILEQIRRNRINKAKAAYLETLRSKADVVFALIPPRTTVPTKAASVRGDAGAPITIVEYADYECPYCQQIEPVLTKIEAEYKGKVAFAYKDMPLPMHSHAEKAAEAAHCAGEQGKYWEYHDQLFSSRKLDIPQLKESARTLQLDPKAFDDCLDSGHHLDTIKAQVEEAQSLQLQGTPTFFINGRLLSGVSTYEQMREVVEQELTATGHNTAAVQR